MKWIYKVPWALVLVVIWASARLAGLQIGMEGPVGMGFMAVCFIALVAEFMRSSDITVTRFRMHLAAALFAVGVTSATTTWLITAQQGIGFADIILWMVVAVNAWLCPVTSFKTALRNITTDVGIGQQPPNEGGNQ